MQCLHATRIRCSTGRGARLDSPPGRTPALRPSGRRPTAVVSRREPGGRCADLRFVLAVVSSGLQSPSGGLLRIRCLTSPVSARRGPVAAADCPEAPPPADSPPRAYASRWGGGGSTRPCLRPPPAPGSWRPQARGSSESASTTSDGHADWSGGLLGVRQDLAEAGRAGSRSALGLVPLHARQVQRGQSGLRDTEL